MEYLDEEYAFAVPGRGCQDEPAKPQRELPASIDVSIDRGDESIWK